MGGPDVWNVGEAYERYPHDTDPHLDVLRLEALADPGHPRS